MRFQKRSPISIPSDNPGWVLVHSLVFILIIQAAAMFALTIIKNDIKSSTVFYTILKQSHAPESKERSPDIRRMILDAPQGWDHALFSTEVLERTWGNTCSCSWRVCLRKQPFMIENEPVLSVCRPHIIILVDTCQSMNSSCGKMYDSRKVYLEQSHGQIVEAAWRSDVQTYLAMPEGTYFRGDYGDTHYRAADTFGLGGTAPAWTFVQSYLMHLLDVLHVCDIAIATTSSGIVQPFTRDHETLASALESLRPDSPAAPLSESLLDLIDDFPDKCATDRHVLVATTGIAINDGNLAAWLKDYDNDGNALDTYVSGPGSHCLDDVAAYAFSRKVNVHTAGPDSAFLKDVAQKGNGAYLPDAHSFFSAFDYVCQMRIHSHNPARFLTNRSARFDPGWLQKTSAAYYQAGPYDPLSLTVLPWECPSSPATFHYEKGGSLFCSTQTDCLLCIDEPTGNLAWAIDGIGGKIAWEDGMIVAGPDAQGFIHALTGQPAILWRHPGALLETSDSSAYIAGADTITSVLLKTGQFQAENTSGSDITSLMYDPCLGILLAGTETGLIHVFDQDLGFVDLFTVNTPETILDIHTFDLNKTLYTIAFTRERAVCMTFDGPVWTYGFTGGTYLNAAVMDSRLYFTTWKGDQDCEGIDTGRSTLTVLNGLSGEKISEYVLLSGKAFGPLIELEEKMIEYTSWDMTTVPVDISALKGIGRVHLGSKRTDRR